MSKVVQDTHVDKPCFNYGEDKIIRLFPATKLNKTFT